jgi:DNA-binding NarL/FixJ family response regulator
MQPQPGTGERPIRVLLCDDVGALRVLLREMLSEAPSIEVVAEAGDGNECLAMAKELEPDVVLLDVAMPILDGLQALKLLRDGAPDIPRVVMLSAFEAQRFRDRAMELGASGYLEKGAPLEEIVHAIHAAVGERAQRSG